MLELNDKDIIGRGLARTCYRYPGRGDRCIKIDHFEVREHTDTRREEKYYRRIARLKPGFNYDCIPRYFGSVPTNRGDGAVFELICDEAGGEISQTLDLVDRDYLKQRALDVKAGLEVLRRSLFDNGILVRDLHPGNIAVKMLADSRMQMVVIDGIGHTEFFPIVDIFPSLARRKLKRYYKKPKYQTVEALLRELDAS